MELLLDALSDSLTEVEQLTHAEANNTAMAAAPCPGSAPGCGELLPSDTRSVQRISHVANSFDRLFDALEDVKSIF